MLEKFFDFKLKTDPRIHCRQIMFLVFLSFLFGGIFWLYFFHKGFVEKFEVDKMFHFASGLTVFLLLRPYAKKDFYAVATVFFIGIVWELVEYFYLDVTEHYFSFINYYFDTLLDMIADIAGPVLLSFLHRKD